MDADQRARIIRELVQAAREASRQTGIIHLKLPVLLHDEWVDSAMTPDETVRVEQGSMDASRGLDDLKHIFGKLARLLDGPPPPLLIRATDDPGRLDIIAREDSGDICVGHGLRQGNGRWRVVLTEPDGTVRVTMPGASSNGDTPDDLLWIATTHLNEHGPWWAPRKD